MSRTYDLALGTTPLARASRRPVRLAVGLALCLTALGLGAAHADMAPGPPPQECVGKPDGTLCILPNGLAGKCKTGQWGRHAGRTWVHCEEDKTECDRLGIGAVCHGYLGQPAHCKEFTNSEKKTWRICQVDGVDAPVVRSVAPAPDLAAAAAPAPPSAPPSAPAAEPQTPAAKKGLLSCSAVTGAAGAGGAGTTALWAAALGLFLRRRRSV